MDGQVPRNYSLVMHQGQAFVQHQNDIVRPRPQTYYASTPEQPSLQQQPVEAAKLNATPFTETHTGTLQTNETQEINPATSDTEKLAIYKHPLFPLLMQLLEKCEQTTNSVDEVTSSSFDMEIKAFVNQQSKDGKGYLVNEPEIDSLMIKALQVLRIHLLELEKVNELCKDFCSRYIACLRAKLNSENLMRTLNVEPGSPSDDEIAATVVNQVAMESADHDNEEEDNRSPSLLYPHQLQTMPAFQYLSNVKDDQTDQKIIETETPIATVTKSTPIELDCNDQSEKEAVPSIVVPTLGTGKSRHTPTAAEKKALKRGVLPKQATSIMKAWLFQNLVHPYPSEEQKKQIADQCNLKILQVNNWFINARRRILQPMLESSPYGNRNRKLKPQKCPAQRAWPDAIGVITPYTTAEATHYQAVATLPDYTIVNSNGEQQHTSGNVSMIINVPPNSTTPMQGGTAPLQYIQVAGHPTMVHGGNILQVTPTLQPCILTPVDGQPGMSKAVPSAQIVSLPVPIAERPPSGALEQSL